MAAAAASAAPMPMIAGLSINFGFPGENHPALELPNVPSPSGHADGGGRSAAPLQKKHNAGLGDGPGAALTRSCLVRSGAGIVEQAALRKPHGEGEGAQQKLAGGAPSKLAPHERSEALPLRPELLPDAAAERGPDNGNEPQGLFMGLLLNDPGVPDQEFLRRMQSHRWIFKGAAEIAERSRGFSFFVWCLLQLQQTVQTDDEGEALDAKLIRACRGFVSSQCRQGNMGDMYQVLTHFICNSLVFHEWDKFLRVVFEDPKANQESFLVPHLEQVWLRFQKLAAVLQAIFGVLDERFCWKHRLPRVGELLYEHMRRRCFSSELVTRNEFFQQATIRDETLKQVKSAFGFT